MKAVERALFSGMNVCPCVPISYPRTYALPGDNPIAIFEESPPSAGKNTPSLRPSLLCSLISMSKPLTI